MLNFKNIFFLISKTNKMKKTKKVLIAALATLFFTAQSVMAGPPIMHQHGFWRNVWGGIISFGTGLSGW